MASPTVDSGVHESRSSWKPQTQHIRLGFRRSGAWLTEIILIVGSGLVPFGIGVLCDQSSDPVPLNSPLVAIQETVARTLGIPLREPNRRVAPLTNLFWSIGLVTPVLVGGWQLWLLAKTGQTLPKKWLGVRVVTDAGTPPGWQRMLVRELLGKWGIPLGISYFIWHISGAYPSLMILTGLSGLMIAGDGLIMRFDSKRRMGHDRIADTLVVDTASGKPYTNPFFSPALDEDAEIAALVVTPDIPTEETPQNLWLWMRQHPGVTILIVTFGSMAAVLGTFVGTQIYIQDQANSRQFKEQDDKVFLALVSQLSPNSDNPTVEQQRAILALGSVKDYRAVPLLVDMLGQETNSRLLGVIEQALVSRGTQAVPELRRLNLAIGNELDSLRNSSNTKNRQLVEARQVTTQRAISKILRVNSGFLQGIDLSHTNLSQNSLGANGFTLVLDRTNLSGITFRSTALERASFQNSTFAAPGPDGRMGTFDDVLADLSGSDLAGANLTRANLSYAILKRTNLFQATLNHANLSHAQLTGINFSSATLVGANLQRATLVEAKFTGSDLAGANLAHANLRGSRFNQAKAEGTQLSAANLTKSDWQGANLAGTDFTRANLTQANFSSARLAGANLQSAQLRNANFTKTSLKNVNFQRANLEGANFKDAQFASEGTDQEFIENRPDTPDTPTLQGVDFTGTLNLDDQQIRHLCQQGAIHPLCP